jgi:hypothetical protein
VAARGLPAARGRQEVGPAGPGVLLRRCAPGPARGELQTDPRELAAVRGAQLLQRRGDANAQRRGFRVRAQLLRRSPGGPRR